MIPPLAEVVRHPLISMTCLKCTLPLLEVAPLAWCSVHGTSVLGAGEDPKWRLKAQCRGRTAEFFPRRGGPYGSARELCDSCPVQPDCLEAGLDWGDEYGMWGGLVPLERRAARQRLRRAVLEPAHEKRSA